MRELSLGDNVQIGPIAVGLEVFYITQFADNKALLKDAEGNNRGWWDLDKLVYVQPENVRAKRIYVKVK